MKTCETELIKLLEIADKLEETGAEAEAKEIRSIESNLSSEINAIRTTLKGIVDKIKTDK